MKKLIMTTMLVTMFVTGLFAAGNKSVATWKSDLEKEFGQIQWVYPDNLKNAKTFKNNDVYYLCESGVRYKITIKNPVATKKGIEQTFEEGWNVYDYATKTFDELEKGDLFVTYDGNSTWIDGEYRLQYKVHLWQMVSQNKMKNALEKTKNGYTCDSTYSNIVLKYSGWSQGDVEGIVGKYTYQGKDVYYKNPNCKYSTNFNIKTGDFSLLKQNYKDLSLTEYKLKYIGEITDPPFFLELVKNVDEKLREEELLKEQKKREEARKAAISYLEEDTAEDKLLVGYIIMSDGTYRNPINYKEESDVFPVGIVCKVNDDGVTGVMLGIHNSGDLEYKWAGETEEEDPVQKVTYRLIEFPEIDREKNDEDGNDNWEYMCSVDPDGTKNPEKYYPAFTYVLDYAKNNKLIGTLYEDGWYMPSYFESNKYLDKNYDLLNVSLSKIGGTLLKKNTYWTSTSWADIFAMNSWMGNGGGSSLAPYRYFENSVCVLHSF